MKKAEEKSWLILFFLPCMDTVGKASAVFSYLEREVEIGRCLPKEKYSFMAPGRLTYILEKKVGP